MTRLSRDLSRAMVPFCYSKYLLLLLSLDVTRDLLMKL